ncbi:MAG TPA: hypothetical protein VKB96_05885 [Gammaproteobacteria bacterium]|nr:hypothetical protein [Gammaproteobacteria bacterium]
MTKYFRDSDGNYLGSFDGAAPPLGSLEVATPPDHAADKYINGAWVPNINAASESVRTALQMAIDLKAQVLGFSGGNALMLYASFPNAFKAIALPFAQWESTVWAEAEAYKQEVIAGNKPMLSGGEAVLLMPEIILPGE